MPDDSDFHPKRGSVVTRRFNSQLIAAVFLWLIVLFVFLGVWDLLERILRPDLESSLLILAHLVRGVLAAAGSSALVLWVMRVLRKSEEKTEQLLLSRIRLFYDAFQNSSDAILITSTSGVMLDVNNAFTSLFGYSREEAVGRTTKILRSRFSTDEFYRSMWQSITAKGEWKGELINKTKGGLEIPIHLSITPIIHEGIKIGYMGVEMDLRERKELERRALEAERLAALGRMSSQVAHEVRNPLSSISLNAELLAEDLEKIGDAKEDPRLAESKTLLNAIQKEVERLAKLADEYLEFSRFPRFQWELVDLNEFFLSFIEFIRPEAMTHGIEIELEAAPGVPKIPIAHRELEQVLHNLVKNGMEAMKTGGRLELGIRKDGGHVVFFVRDQGAGIDAETQKKIFDPFFTTKEQGSGLGLSLARQIVLEHSGAIWCESKLGEGSTFYVQLPLESGCV